MIQNTDKELAAFKKLSLITLIAVYFLILVGGIVRSTGSGMGCPDWPKCFGSWIPPTSENQLPENYQDKYSMQRHEKNIKLANYLSALGMKNTAMRILDDDNIRVEEEFNAVKTWTEYINRLVGATIGFLIFLTTLASFRLWKRNKVIVIMSVITLGTIGFQGWLGSLVVSTKLLPGMVTTHMLLALVIVAMITFLWFKGNGNKFELKGGSLNIIIILSLIALAIQVLLGTQVRERVDVAGAAAVNSGDWVNQIGLIFYVHRSFSIIILIISILLVNKIVKEIGRENQHYKLSRIVAGLVILEMMTGASMAYFSIPPFLQPIHLLLGTLVFGLTFLLFLSMSSEKYQIEVME
jgi:cytochrome c oxidase assembly protein subunit 15